MAQGNYASIDNTIVDNIQAIFKEKTGKDVEVMIYGDGAFKDPVGKIWNLLTQLFHLLIHHA